MAQEPRKTFDGPGGITSIEPALSPSCNETAAALTGANVIASLHAVTLLRNQSRPTFLGRVGRLTHSTGGFIDTGVRGQTSSRPTNLPRAS